MSQVNTLVLRHGGCEVRGKDMTYIRRFLTDFPELSRSETILTLSEHLGWTTLAGAPKYDAARSLLEQLDQAAEIRLPPLTNRGPKKGRRRSEPKVLVPAVASMALTAPEPPPSVECALADLAPVKLRLVTERDDVAHVNACLRQFHPLGYTKPFGFFARYRIESAIGSLGCILMSGAARALEARDRHIGWTLAQRRRNIPWVINNSRFLIFPSVKVPIWPVTCWHNSPANCLRIGSVSGPIDHCCSKPLLIRRTTVAVVISVRAGMNLDARVVGGWRDPVSAIKVHPR